MGMDIESEQFILQTSVLGAAFTTLITYNEFVVTTLSRVSLAAIISSETLTTVAKALPQNVHVHQVT